MKIAANKVVTIDYKVTTDQGMHVDSSKDSEPLSYIQGIGNMIPGLESALEGKSKGDRLTAVVPPEEGYGQRDETLQGMIPKNRFDPAVDLQPGMRFEMPLAEGRQVVTVVGMEGENVVVDGNHPLAGIPLHFDVTVVNVRDATPAEMDHRHVHADGIEDH